MKRILLLFVAIVGLGSAGFAQINSFPYTQDFEGYALCGTGCGAICALPGGPNDFTNAAGDNLDWLTDVSGTGSSNTGPTANGGADHNPGVSGGKYLYVETSCSGTGYPSMTANLWSPQIDLVGTNNVQFNFWYHLYGTSQGFIHVDISTDFGATWTNDVIPTWTDNQDIWQEETISLGAYVGDTVIVRLRFITGTSFGSDVAVDDFRIYDILQDDAGITAFIDPAIPTCNFNDSVSVEITNLGADTLFTANIDWEWNTVGQPTYAWSGALANGETMNVYLGSVTYGTGDNLKAWTSMPNGVVESASGAGNDTTEIIGLIAGLSGTYTIGGTTPDFVDFATAIVAMNTFGICGPTTFDVRTGTYPEQVILGTYIGMDATNTVTFRSEAGHRDSVIIEFAATLAAANYVVLMNDADYFNFEQMTIRNTGITFGRVLDVQGGSDWNTFWDIRFHTVVSNTTSTNIIVIYSGNGTNDNYNTFTGNTFEGGSYGTYWYGQGTTSLEMGSVFDGNVFLDNYYYGSSMYYMDAPVLTNNVATGASTYTGTRYAFYFSYIDNGSVITHNQVVTGTSLTGWRYGIYMVNCDATTANRGLIANNMFEIGIPSSTATEYGIYFSNTGFMDVYNNSVNVVGSGLNSRAFYGTSGGANTLTNNNFVNNGPGYAIYLASNYTVTEMDYNNIYAPAGNAGYFNGTAQLTFADWQASSGYDANGISVDPQFISNSDLHVCGDSLNGMGISLALITDDFDGQPRDASTPDIGADEHAPLNTNFLGADAVFCIGETITLWAGSPADTVVWSTGDTSNILMVTSAGTYIATVNGPCGSGVDTVVVSASALVYTNYLVADTMQFCQGGSALLSSSMVADTYSWTGGATTPTLSVTTGGTYQLDITDGCGSGSETIVIAELTSPTASFTWVNSFATAIFTNTTGANGTPTYAWDFGDGNFSSMSDPTHVYSVIGTYYVTLTVTNECGTSMYGDSVTLSSVGLNNLFAAGEISVYPNPSTGEFTISMDVLTTTDVEIRIENVLGAVVYETNLGVIEGVYSEEVSLGDSPAGMYFVRIIAGDQQLVKKIILE